MSGAQDRVNCYLPAKLKDEFRELVGTSGPTFSEILRRGVASAVAEARAKRREADADALV